MLGTRNLVRDLCLFFQRIADETCHQNVKVVFMRRYVGSKHRLAPLVQPPAFARLRLYGVSAIQW